MKSWKTTVGGFIAGGLMILGEICDLIGVAVGEGVTNGTFDIAILVAGLGAVGIGWFARDNDKTSEAAGAKKDD